MTTILKYNGNGEGIPGIPAQDLDETELSRLQEVLVLDRDALIEQLTSRGLYSLPAQSKPSKKPTIADTPSSEDSD